MNQVLLLVLAAAILVGAATAVSADTCRVYQVIAVEDLSVITVRPVETELVLSLETYTLPDGNRSPRDIGGVLSVAESTGKAVLKAALKLVGALVGWVV